MCCNYTCTRPEPASYSELTGNDTLSTWQRWVMDNASIMFKKQLTFVTKLLFHQWKSLVSYCLKQNQISWWIIYKHTCKVTLTGPKYQEFDKNKLWHSAPKEIIGTTLWKYFSCLKYIQWLTCEKKITFNVATGQVPQVNDCLIAHGHLHNYIFLPLSHEIISFFSCQSFHKI